MPRADFQQFYYRNVALGEGCGCAEQIISTRDMDARAHAQKMLRNPSKRPLRMLARWLGRVIRRPVARSERATASGR